MLEALRRVLAIPELRAKILFTLSLLAVCRIGAYVPVPGINSEVAIMMFKYATRGGQNLFQLCRTRVFVIKAIKEINMPKKQGSCP